MTRHRALAALVLALMLAFLQPTSAAAGPRPEIRAVQLTGVCPFAEGAGKDVSTVLLGNPLITPYFLFDGGAWTGAVLMPYKVKVVDGLGLKARHLLPGEVYTRPGPAPAQSVTCTFAGTTPDGDVDLEVEGTVIQMPRSSRPR